MKDQEYLMWLHERLEHVHREPAQADYMHKLRAIIEATPEDKETPNVELSGPGKGPTNLSGARGASPILRVRMPMA